MINTYSYFSLDAVFTGGLNIYYIYGTETKNGNDIKFRKKGGVGYDDK